MSSDPLTWVVAGLEVATAVGIAAFWIFWFRESHDQEWLPAGYVDHEAPFVFTDSLLAGVLDLAYFARTGMFRRDRGGLVNAGVVAGVLILAVVLLVRFF